MVEGLIQKLRTISRHTYVWLVLLLAFALLMHRTWLSPFNLFSHTDWFPWPNQAVRELWYSYGTWVNSFNLGAPNIQINFLGFYGLWSVLLHIGIPYTMSVWLTFLLPIAIFSLICPFFLVKKLTKNNIIAFSAAMFYGTVIYFLARQSSQLAMVFIFALAPSIFLYLIKALEANSRKDWLVCLLLLWISSIYELRVTCILTVILISYSIVFYWENIFRKQLINIVLVTVLFVGLSMFWLLPTLLGHIGSTIGQVANSGVFGNSLFDLAHAFTISDSSWTGSRPNEVFIPQQVKPYLFLLPIIAFSPLIILSRYTIFEKKRIIFFVGVALVGIFLTKQSAPPLGFLYEYFYKNLPGFNLYREASKFYLITGVAFLFLIAYALLGMRRKAGRINEGYFFTSVCVLIAIACINAVPLIRNDFSGMIAPRHVPQEYVKFNSFIDSQNEYSRTAWLPTASRWVTYSNFHPYVNLNSEMEKEWRPFVNDEEAKNPTYQQAMDLLQQPFAKRLISDASIKYIVVPTRDVANDDDFIKQFGNDRVTFINALDQIPWLQKVNGFGDLAVFQNKDFNSYVSVNSALTKVDNFSNFSSAFLFSQSYDTKQFNFTDFKNVPHTAETNGVFTSIDRYSLSNSSIKASLPVNAQGNIVYDARFKDYTYSTSNKTITISANSNSQLSIVGNIVKPKTTNSIITTPYADGNEYFLKTDTTLLKISNNEQLRNVGTNKSVPQLFSSNGINILSNGNFEDGLWQKKVSDCNNYDHKPLISMNKSVGPSIGSKSVALTSLYHTACTTHEPIKVNPGKYALAFQYSAKNTDTVRYELHFNDKRQTVVRNSFSVGDDNWRRDLFEFVVPNGATQVSLTLFGNPDQKLKNIATTKFTDVSMVQLQLVSAISSSANQASTYTVNASTADKVTLSQTGINYQNLISNPSFENGLWQQKVGDCNAYDNKPILEMHLNKHDATDGHQSLELDAKSHIACTSPQPISVNESSNYFVSFDYKSPNGSQAGYSIAFNDANNSRVSGIIQIKDDKWHTFNRLFTTPYGATRAVVTVYSYSNEQQDSRIINYYDNFFLAQLPDNLVNYHYLHQTKFDGAVPTIASIVQINPTEKNIQITNAQKPFYLSIAEAYNDQWKLKVVGDRQSMYINSRNHYSANSSLNGWYVNVADICGKGLCMRNQNGTYSMRLTAEFSPQKYFKLGVILTGISLFMSFSLLFISIRKKCKDNHGSQ